MVDVTVLFCYIGALFTLSFASGVGIGYVWIRIPRPPRPRGVTASLLFLDNAIWAAGVALEMLSTDLNSKIFWHAVQFSAMSTVPTLWLVYVLQLAGRQRWLTIRTYALLSVAPCVTYLLALTNESHGLVFARLAMDSMNPLMPLKEEFGPWVQGGLFYVSVLVAITSFVIIQMLVRSRQIYWRQSAALLLTLSLPWMAFALYALEPDLLSVSLAPLVSAMAGILLLMVNPSRLQSLDVVPVAHRVITDRMNDPVFVLNEQGRIMQLNPAAEHLISLPAEGSIGKQMEAVLPQWSAFAEAPQKEQTETPELVIGDDTYDARSSQIVDWRGRVTSQIWVLRNITEGKRMERELRQSEERYRLIAENMTETIWLMDMDLKPTYISPSAVPLRGYTLEELYALPIDRQLTPDSLKLAWETYNEALSEENLNSKDAPTSITLELEFYRKDGSTFWNESTFTLVRNSKGEPAGILAVGRDITERKRMESELRRHSEHLEEEVLERTKKLAESESRFRTIFDSVRTSIMIIDPKTHVIVDANPAAIEMAGAPKEQIVGSVCHKYVCPAEEGRCPITDLGQTIDHAERVFLRTNGKTTPVMKSVRRIVLGGQEHLLESFIDITERKKLEAQLAESQRLATIGSTATMVGHDLRNPLQGLAGMVYLLKQHYEGIPVEHKKTTEFDATEALHMMEKSVGYMNKIVSDLQNYAAPLQPELRKVSIHQLFKETLSAIAIPAHVKVSVTVDKGAETLNADPDLVKRVFTNLTINAVQAMPQGGELKITAQENGEEELISFQDTGVGISREALPKVFEPLFTTKPQGQGLGLAVCKRVMEAHGGTITVDSTVGKGSTFTARLPIPRNMKSKPLPTQSGP